MRGHEGRVMVMAAPAPVVWRRARAASWSVILPAPMADADAEIISAVLQGDTDRYAALVDQYQDQAIRLAFSLLGNYEDARDASQEAFVNAYRALGRFRGGAKFSTWLHRIVINECKDVYKRRARQPVSVVRVGAADPDADDGLLFVDVADPAAGPADQTAGHELNRALSAAIARLSFKQRTVFVLHHLHGRSLDDVAGILRCRVGTVKSHLFRATQHLRRQLTPWLPGEEL